MDLSLGFASLAGGGPFSMTQCCEEDLEPRFTLLPVSPRIGMCMKVLFRVCNPVNCIDRAKARSDHVSIAAAIAEDFPDGSAAWISAGDVERMLRATEGRSSPGFTTKPWCFCSQYEDCFCGTCDLSGAF